MTRYTHPGQIMTHTFGGVSVGARADDGSLRYTCCGNHPERCNRYADGTPYDEPGYVDFDEAEGSRR